jgi:hypothetical protein
LLLLLLPLLLLFHKLLLSLPLLLFMTTREADNNSECQQYMLTAHCVKKPVQD